MSFQEQLTQALSPQDFLFTQTVNNTTVSTSPGIDMSKFHRAIWYIEMTGSVANAAILSAIQPQSSQNSNFVPFHNMTGFSVSNVTLNNNVISVEVRADQVTYQNPNDRYVRLNMTGSTQALTATVIGLGGISPQSPGNQYTNSSIVVQQVVCTT
jgi:hypothetical protein